ncbi:MAG: N-Acetylneuraminate cytidylyltransferase [Candidatus Jettenia ecosi]|uniref:N-Acetylneuraminate cytidylyltransferase n=1 Tax=Candidatus Jettenia ecosi TaxID=2494326 RepID=A0A533QAA5_9BACT|nr:MAG: N-Acetylneuraminate cytidylyltransferase [Candidatus Jettenia ecosi]
MIAIVPARGGSKGLPGKNIKELLGKPMIASAIEEGLRSRYLSEVIVSTDDKEIAEVAVRYGAKCPFMRPVELATDKSLAMDTYTYTIERLNKEFGYNIREFVVLQPTSPLRIAEDIDNTIEIFKTHDADSAVSFTKEHHPISWHKFLDENNKITPLFEEKVQNRQEIRPTYYPNGAVYVFKLSVVKSGRYYTENSYAYVMPADRSVDVDTIDDFEYAEFLLRKRYEK